MGAALNGAHPVPGGSGAIYRCQCCWLHERWLHSPDAQAIAKTHITTPPRIAPKRRTQSNKHQVCTAAAVKLGLPIADKGESKLRRYSGHGWAVIVFGCVATRVLSYNTVYCVATRRSAIMAANPMRAAGLGAGGGEVDEAKLEKLTKEYGAPGTRARTHTHTRTHAHIYMRTPTHGRAHKHIDAGTHARIRRYTHSRALTRVSLHCLAATASSNRRRTMRCCGARTI
jgi:hypothetical protein